MKKIASLMLMVFLLTIFIPLPVMAGEKIVQLTVPECFS